MVGICLADHEQVRLTAIAPKLDQPRAHLAINLGHVMRGQVRKPLLHPRRHGQHARSHGSQHAGPIGLDIGGGDKLAPGPRVFQRDVVGLFGDIMLHGDDPAQASVLAGDRDRAGA